MVTINRDPVEGVSVYSIIFRPPKGGYLKPPAMRVVDDSDLDPDLRAIKGDLAC